MKRLAPTFTRWHTSELGSVCGMLCKRRSVDPQTRRLFLSHSTDLSCLPSRWHLTEVQFHFSPHHIHHHVTELKILMKTFSNHCRSLSVEKKKQQQFGIRQLLLLCGNKIVTYFYDLLTPKAMFQHSRNWHILYYESACFH